jgi:hypothetical protein
MKAPFVTPIRSIRNKPRVPQVSLLRPGILAADAKLETHLLFLSSREPVTFFDLSCFVHTQPVVSTPDKSSS